MKKQQIKSKEFLYCYQYTYIHLVDCLREKDPQSKHADKILNFLTAIHSIFLNRAYFYPIGVKYDDVKTWDGECSSVATVQDFWKDKNKNFKEMKGLVSDQFSKHDEKIIVESFHFFDDHFFSADLELESSENKSFIAIEYKRPFPELEEKDKDFCFIPYAEGFPCFHSFCLTYEAELPTRVKMGKWVQSFFPSNLYQYETMYQLIKQKKIHTLLEVIEYVNTRSGAGISTRTAEISKNNLYIDPNRFQDPNSILALLLNFLSKDLAKITLDYTGISTRGLK